MVPAPDKRPPPARAIIGAALAVLIAPVVADLALSGPRRPFGYLAADAFYYLTVARNLALHGSLSFDGVHPTNGFHPLWQLLLAALYGAGSAVGLAEPGLLTLTVLACTALLAVALWLLGRALTDDAGRLPWSFVLVPVGAYALLVSPIWFFGARFGMKPGNIDDDFPPLYGTLWSYANGMESAVVVAGFAGAAWWFVRRAPLDRPRDAAGFGLLLGGMTLGRLDHALIAAALLGWWAAGAWRRGGRRSLLPSAAAGLAFALPLGAYLVANHIGFGMWMPVSGRLKMSFPRVHWPNLQHLEQVLTHPLTLHHWRLLRQLQILVPGLVAAAALPWLARRSATIDRFLAGCAPGVIALALYNELYVELLEQGHWYFPVSTLFVSLVALRALASYGPWPSRRFTLAGLVAGAAIALFFFVRFERRLEYHQRLADVYFRDAPALRLLYAGRPAPRLIEFDDGIVAFATGFSTVPYKGYVFDPEAFDAYRRGRLMDLELARGYNRMVSVSYLSPKRLGPSGNLADPAMRTALPGAPAHGRYTVEYIRDPFVVVRLDPP